MDNGKLKFIFFWFLIVVLMLPGYVEASVLTMVSDRISTSGPGYWANHNITFRATSGVPPLGKIMIYPDSDDFVITPGFDYTNVDLATSSDLSGPFLDRDLAAVNSASEDGVTVNTGASSTLNNFTITLNSTYGLSAGDYVRVELGNQASFGTSSDKQILNAAAVGSYMWHFETYDAGNNLIDRAYTVIIMVEPVRMTGTMTKIRSNGTPSGFLSYGTVQTIMSLITNYEANCRYTTASGTPYALMTDTFSATNGYYHSELLTGLANGMAYTYYIRCRDTDSVDDDTDYIITFQLEGQEDTGGTDEPGNPGRGGGGSGGGGGGGSGQDSGRGTGDYLPYPPPPGLPGVVLTGWAYPSAIVTILKDGTEIGKALAGGNGQFGAFVEELNQGVYTFSLWALDLDNRRSSTYSTTFWIDAGTLSTVSDIILSPTISTNKTEYGASEPIEVIGYGAPGKNIDVWLYPKTSGKPDESTVDKQSVTVLSDGKWKAFYNTSNLENGVYQLKAKSTLETIGESDFSQVLNFAVGGILPQPTCSGADLNQDGRVNITDFSILLYYWGTDDACADQNDDGDVNLTDFSIMMFYWTG